jgi:hypothetical protein
MRYRVRCAPDGLQLLSPRGATLTWINERCAGLRPGGCPVAARTKVAPLDLCIDLRHGGIVAHVAEPRRVECIF